MVTDLALGPALSEEFPVVAVAVVFEPEQSAVVEPAVGDVGVFGRFLNQFPPLGPGLLQWLRLQVQLGAAARRDLVLYH